MYDLEAAKALDSAALAEARQFHEYSIFLYVIQKNFKEFEKNFYRVEYFYNELADQIGAQSDNYDVVRGLYLLFLLSFNR